ECVPLCAREAFAGGVGQLRRVRPSQLSAVVLACLVAAPVLVHARRADALFRYWTRQNLARALASEPDKWVDTDVTVPDALGFVYPDDPAGELDKERASGTKVVRFDT